MVRVRNATRMYKVFTRVQPDSRGTSIVIHVREGWEELRLALLPDHGAVSPNPHEPKRRWGRAAVGCRLPRGVMPLSSR